MPRAGSCGRTPARGTKHGSTARSRTRPLRSPQAWQRALRSCSSRMPRRTSSARSPCRPSTPSGRSLAAICSNSGTSTERRRRAAAAPARGRDAPGRARRDRRHLQPQDQAARSQTGEVKTLAGTGKPGHRDGAGRKAQFYEPSGLSVNGDTIFVADTNNHCIRVVNVKDGTTSTLSARGRRTSAWYVDV